MEERQLKLRCTHCGCVVETTVERELRAFEALLILNHQDCMRDPKRIRRIDGFECDPCLEFAASRQTKGFAAITLSKDYK